MAKRGRPTLEEAVSPEELTRYIFTSLSITDRGPWTGKTATQVVTDLLETAALSLKELGVELGLTYPEVWRLAHSHKQEDVERLLTVLKPRLEKMKDKGLLNPESLMPDTERLKKYVFTTLGITNIEPWEEKTLPEILAKLRDIADLTQKEVGEKLGLNSPLKAWQLEHSCTQQGVEAIVGVLKPLLDALQREGWLNSNTLMPDARQLKKNMCAKLGITDCAPWDAMSVTQMLTGLRENAGMTQDEVGKKLDLTRERIRQIEEAGTLQSIKRLLPVLKPRLEKLAKEGWLNPRNLTVINARYAEIANVCRTLRKAKGMSTQRFDDAVTNRGLKKFDSGKFERNLLAHSDGGPMPFATLLSITDQLRQFYYCPTTAALLDEAALYKEKAEGKFTANLAAKSPPESSRGR